MTAKSFDENVFFFFQFHSINICYLRVDVCRYDQDTANKKKANGANTPDIGKKNVKKANKVDILDTCRVDL